MKNTNYKNWHYQHAKVWKIMPSPARPSLGECAIFRKYLEEFAGNMKRKTKVMILGATPEFRDLCNSTKYEVTCVDINQSNHKALTLLQKKKNAKEKFIKGNWLTFKDKCKFDVILGDAVTTMLPLVLYEQFFENMNFHLKRRGLFIVRIPYQEQKYYVPLTKVIRQYQKIKKYKYTHIYTATFNYLVMNYLDKKSSSINLSYLGDKLKDLLHKGLISKNEYEELEPYFKNLTLELSYPKQDYIFSLISKHFTFLAKEFSLDYLTSYSNPIFVFEKRVK